MRSNTLRAHATRLGTAAALLGAGLVAMTGPASSQPAMPGQTMSSEPVPFPDRAMPPQQQAPVDQARQPQHEEVVVTAPRVVRQTVGRSKIGAPIELVSISREVSYADLDLTRQSDAETLRQRIKDTAVNLCAELDKMNPLGPRDPDCMRKADNTATAQADRAIQLAQR